MSEVPALMVACLAGVALGGFFFGGLWWTVQKGLASEQPALWFFPSSMLRTGVVVAGFYFVSGSQWPRIVACLLGFVAAKQLIAWLCGPKRATGRSLGRRVVHAPHSR